ncbi:transposase [Paenibacillus thiaminolyticus]|uniref:transposase n=1 Tax=Paenibacillus thiaminolyticus TaxID=49283 RepID=UPI003D2AA95E
MKIVLIAAFIAVPFVMAGLAHRYRALATAFHLLAVLSFFVAGSIFASVIYDVIKQGTELTSQVHTVFLYPSFRIAGAYAGLYIPYRLLRELAFHLDDKRRI